MTKTQAIFGPPGTGKTTFLTNLIEELCKRTPNVAVVSFSRAAARELTSRIAKDQTRFIGTIHSYCFNTIGLTRSQIATIEKFDRHLDSGIYLDRKEKDQILSVGGYSRRMDVPLHEAYMESNISRTVPYHIFESVWTSFLTWKNNEVLTDFDDMLFEVYDHIDQQFDIVVVDEAQDISRLQWDVVKAMVKEDGEIYLAGDDDQSIFSYLGIDPLAMERMADEVKVLDQSYRIPAAVHRLAEKTIARVENRTEKSYKPRDFEGHVEFAGDVLYCDLDVEGSRAVLCRDRYKMRDVAEDLMRLTQPYTCAGEWSPFNSKYATAIRAAREGDLKVLQRPSIHKILNPVFAGAVDEERIPDFDSITQVIDAPALTYEAFAYLTAVDLDADPIQLSTIHSFKGKEADHVFLICDCSGTVEEALDITHTFEDEVRVWYVGITRAMNTLTLIGRNNFIPF